MEYIWIALVSFAVALLGNRFFQGSGYGLIGDGAFALAGGIGAVLAFRTLEMSASTGLVGVLIFAAIGAALMLLVRRSFSLG